MTTPGQQTLKAIKAWCNWTWKHGQGLFWFRASKICHFLTYLDSYPLTYSPKTHTGQLLRKIQLKFPTTPYSQTHITM